MRNWAVLWLAVGMVCWGLGFLGGLGGLDAEEGPVFDAKGNIIQRAAQPKTEDLRKAEKLVEEVFGKNMAKARSAQEKSKLAQEILQSAREEQDMAVRFAALQAARRLAIEALDGKLGLEIVREIVQTYEPLEEMTKEDRLSEADHLWGQAEKSQGREKLAKQLEAAEYWFYADIKTGLVVKKWEERMTGLRDVVLIKPYPPEVQRALKAITGRPITLLNAASGFSMNVSQERKDPGAPVMQYPLLPDKVLPSSRWIARRQEEDVFVFESLNSKLCLSVAPERTDIVQLPYNGDALQQWILIPTATGGFLFKNKGNGLYMSPPESRLHEGTGLFTHPRRNNDSEVWRIVPARP